MDESAKLQQQRRDDLIVKHVTPWCRQHPRGNIFSNGYNYMCSHFVKDQEDSTGRTILLEDVDLRIGIISGKEGYEYDCFHSDAGNVTVDGGYSFYILNLLQEILGFRTRTVATDTWGVYDEAKKNWTGLVGLAKGNLIDLGVCHMTQTRDRGHEVDFLLSTLASTRSLAHDSSRLHLIGDVFVRTFTPMLWICFFLSVFLLILCFRFSTWLHSTVRPDHEPWSWDEVVMWANAAVCQQSYSRHPKGLSCRTTFLIGYLITYLLYTGFAAGVTSLLAVEERGVNLKLKDVLSMDLNLVLLSNGSHLDYLKDSPDVHARQVYSKLFHLIQEDEVSTLKELFSKIQGANYIGLGSTTSFVNYLRRHVPALVKSDFIVSRIPNSLHQKAFIVPKNSPYRETFNFWLVRLQETGLIRFGTSKYIQTVQSNFWHGARWSSAGLGHVSSANIIWAGGCLLSVIILFVEMAWKK